MEPGSGFPTTYPHRLAYQVVGDELPDRPADEEQDQEPPDKLYRDIFGVRPEERFAVQIPASFVLAR